MVADEYTKPLALTLTAPALRDERYRELPMVDDEVVKNPFRPRSVEVETKVLPEIAVNGQL